MRMAYLIFAHDGLAQLDLLLDRLVPEGSPDVAIIHADRRSALWRQLSARWPSDCERIRLVRDPVAVRWGHWSQVAAIARLVRAALACGCDYAHLLSGADWPVASRATIAADLEAGAPGQCYIEAVAHLQEERMATFRLDSRWLRTDPDHARLAHAACWELRRLSRWGDTARTRLGLMRSRPWGPWHKGSTWWSLPTSALDVLACDLDGLLRSGRLVGTLCCDEHVIPTIVAARFADQIASNRRHIRFPEGIASPRVLTAQDWPEIAASGAWFMRKVSLEEDPFFLALPNRDDGVIALTGV